MFNNAKVNNVVLTILRARGKERNYSSRIANQLRHWWKWKQLSLTASQSQNPPPKMKTQVIIVERKDILECVRGCPGITCVMLVTHVIY